MYLEKFKARLLESHLATEKSLIGCTNQEIKSIFQQLRVKLPLSYLEFLSIMGKGAGQFLRGSDCFYSSILELTNAARELLEETHFTQSLPDDAFVFFMHQGYQFSFFRLTEGEDPPIYYYCEGETQLDFLKTHERFSQFLMTEIEIHEKYLRTLTHK